MKNKKQYFLVEPKVILSSPGTPLIVDVNFKYQTDILRSNL